MEFDRPVGRKLAPPSPLRGGTEGGGVAHTRWLGPNPHPYPSPQGGGGADCWSAGSAPPALYTARWVVEPTSKRSAFITLVQAATKSRTNFGCESAWA